MLGSVDGFLPRPRMAVVGLAQNPNFGLRGIRISSLLLSSPYHSTTTAIVASKSGFFYIFFAFIVAFLALPCALYRLSTNLYLIPGFLILGLSVVVYCLKLGRFRKGSSSSDNDGGSGLCANCGSKTQSLKLKGGKGGNEIEREKEAIKELRRKLRRERKRRRVAMEELEREREAAAWASQEAMAKIMLLQSDKAAAEREARQFREATEQRELHDKEVIEYLQLLLSTISMEKNGGEMESSGVL